MSRLGVQAETIKLARLLGVPESRLQGYAHLDAVSLRAIRESASAAIFDDARPMLVRVAAASKLLPVPLIALVAEKIFGTMLCARTVGLIAPQRALEVTLKLPDAFLADASSQIDPRSVKEFIAGIPVARVKTVAAQLIQREDYVTMGRFVDYVPRETIRSVIESIGDNAVLLHTAFFVENKSRLNDIMDLLPESRLREIVRLAGRPESGVWAEALALMNQVSREWCGRIGDLTADEDAVFLTQMLKLTQDADLWDALLPVIACMSPQHRRKLAQIPVLADVQILNAIIYSTHVNGLWAEFLPLVGFMGADARKAAAQVMEHLPQELLAGLIEAADTEKLWPALIGILTDMQKREQREVIGLVLQQADGVLRALFEAVQGRHLWASLLPLLHDLSDADVKRLAHLLPDYADLHEIEIHAVRLGLWQRLEAPLRERFSSIQ